MEKLKLIIMAISTVFILLVCGVSAWMSLTLPGDDPNLRFFQMAFVICLAAAFWYGFNTWNLWRKK